MSIEARNRTVALDATSLIVVKTAPSTFIRWSVVGNGTLEPLSVVTDENGVAAAKLTPTGAVGDLITVTAEYVGP